MRLITPPNSVALVLMSSALTFLPVHAAAPALATTKFRLCQSCSMPAIPVTLPHQGIVLSFGSIFGENSRWYVVDLERSEATRIVARADRLTKEMAVVERDTQPLPSGPRSELTQIANRIWVSEDALPSKMATDVIWSLWLLDGDDVRHESAAGRPEGMAKDIEQIMTRLIR